MNEKKRAQIYPSPEITVQFDPNLCEHSGICIRRLPSVFNLQARPWVNVHGASKDDIIALIDKCPSGALTWTTPQADHPHVDATGATQITIMPNGPLRLTGHIRILDKEGNLLHEADKCVRFAVAEPPPTNPFAMASTERSASKARNYLKKTYGDEQSGFCLSANRLLRYVANLRIEKTVRPIGERPLFRPEWIFEMASRKPLTEPYFPDPYSVLASGRPIATLANPTLDPVLRP